MDYELAKQLKDAGFPQNKYGSYDCQHNVNQAHTMLSSANGVGDCEFVQLPTLEELIEACGDKFGFLSKIQGENTFIAAIPGGTAQFVDKTNSPSEAVAKLWLELNKK